MNVPIPQRETWGKVYRYIVEKLEDEGGLVFVVVDPPDYTPEKARKVAEIAERAGVSAFAVGGSLGAQGKTLDDVVLALKDASDLPVILFPGNIATLTPHADAIYFMSLLNSNDPYYISGAQIAAAFPVRRMGLEVIPTSYILVEPGRAVGWVGRAQLIPRDVPYLAAAAALAGQLMGHRAIILESGSGAESPAPPQMVKAVSKVIDIPLIVAGGVRNPDYAYQEILAGADIVHVGTAVDRAGEKEAERILKKYVSEVRRAARDRQA